MDFLLEYGTFLAKLATVLIAVVLGVGIIIAIAARAKGQPKQSKLIVSHLNADLHDLAGQLKSHTLLPHELKKLAKQEKADAKKKKKAKRHSTVYVLNFVGDMQASSLKNLSDTISLLIAVSKPNQEVVLKLESAGGYVHSYGLAAAQLMRLKEHKLKLTVCVDKVAASGGYLMAAMADKIYAAPFAILGSIGVVGMVPNINKLLKQSNVDIEYHTSGKYKRTLTVLGKNEPKGRKKFQQDLEQTHDLFKKAIKEHRPVLSLPKVATGETWYGTEAKNFKLVDEISTSDEYLYRRSATAELYEVALKTKRGFVDRIGRKGEDAVSSIADRALEKLLELRLFNL